jgi:hypothetical protein
MLNERKLLTYYCPAILIGPTEQMVGKQSGEIDPLLEPLLSPTRDEEVDLFLSQLIATRAEPVITGIIRHKLHINSRGGIEQSDADDIGLLLEDAKIAELLQLTRRQVINARKSARRRLTRRLKGFI